MMDKPSAINMTGHQSDLPKLAGPAQRALAGVGITGLEQLANLHESELARLHGIGPNALQTLRQVLEEKGLTFRPESM